MKIHEYQAKQLLRERGLPVPRGQVASTAAEARAAAEALGGALWVVKAQIHAGGRGKGGGVQVCRSLEEVVAAAERILAQPLVTPQTGPEGRPVHRVLVEEGLAFTRELYLGITLDRAARRSVIMASAAGGMEIEEVAARDPRAILKVHVDPVLGLKGFQSNELGRRLGLEGLGLSSFQRLLEGLYALYLELNCSLVEINPLVLLSSGAVMALDCKLSFDGAALPRHPELAPLHDPSEEDPLELKAAQANLSYVNLDGDIGCMVNGAGLAMATMDLVLHEGGRPANFLDVGGAATVERVATAMRLILDDPRVRGVFVNIFGGIVRCDVVAKGVLEATRARSLRVPIVLRLVGTNEAEGKAILDESDLGLIQVQTMAEGAKAIVKAIGGAS